MFCKAILHFCAILFSIFALFYFQLLRKCGKEMGGFLIALAAQFKLKTFPVLSKSFQFHLFGML